MVFQDGQSAKNYVPVVFDNMIAKGEIPVTVGIFIDPGHKKDKLPEKPGWQPAPENRSFEYDTLSDQYARLMLEEILPEVAAQVPVFVAGGIGTNKGYLYYRSPGWTSGTWQQEWCCQFEDGGGEEPEDYEDTCTLPTQYTIQVLDAGTGHSIAAGYAGEIYAFESGTSNFDPCECAAGTGFCASGDTWVEKSTAIAGVNYSHETPYFSGARVSNTTAVVAGAFGRITRYVDGGSPEVADATKRHADGQTRACPERGRCAIPIYAHSSRKGICVSRPGRSSYGSAVLWSAIFGH